MDDDHRDLELRRHSIRTLTTTELSLANGGRGNQGSSPTSGPTDRTHPTVTR
ncbi:hypothetical protein [Mycolicibacterium fluoranthenivorans]|jgi:hypothetical protein|uniref:Uncharacterized protein n=1 Tax=Mycolicibacterium fluoranthenivorans TaxID=258505 RepID=A0A1G4X2H2_9MYCO|nr:hypothetical protein [Mycolicibacterium fluoranthenivorans]SCX33565.1 hypothetical protein SAMN02799620_05987 [Mycolicibacterium fluoranthenivorans]